MNAQLFDSKTQESIKSFQIDGSQAQILDMIDSVSVLIKNSLIIAIPEKVKPEALHK